MSTDDQLFEKAEQAGTWKSLVSFPRLLFRWQIRYPRDKIRIAAFTCHMNGVNGMTAWNHTHHHWCDTQEKCNIIQKFYEDNRIQEKLL